MSQKQTKIDPLRGTRLKLILGLERWTNERVAEALGFTPEHISYMVCGKRAVTERTARKIIELFPKYRLEWLLGLDDFPTNAALDEAQAEADEIRTKTRMLFLVHISSSAGFSFRVNGENNDQYVVFPLGGGEVVARGSASDLTAFLDDLEDYAKFKLCMLVEKRATKEMEDIINGNH